MNRAALSSFSSRQSRMTTAGAGPARMADRNARGSRKTDATAPFASHRSAASDAAAGSSSTIQAFGPGASSIDTRSATIPGSCTPRAGQTAPIYHDHDDLHPQAEDP